MNYDGPRIKKKYFKKPFCQNFKPMNGFVKARFIDVADGDTAFFDISGCNECVRFMVVNCPKCDEIANSFENYGKEAKEYVKNILLCAKEIYLEDRKSVV